MPGFYCAPASIWYSQCRPDSERPASAVSASTVTNTISLVQAVASASSSAAAAASPIPVVNADASAVAAWGKCGGLGTPSYSCVANYHCEVQNPYYWQCVPGAPTAAVAAASQPAESSVAGVAKPAASSSSSDKAAVAAWGKCGGLGFGDFPCVSGYTCSKESIYYSQCVPASKLRRFWA